MLHWCQALWAGDAIPWAPLILRTTLTDLPSGYD